MESLQRLEKTQKVTASAAVLDAEAKYGVCYLVDLSKCV
jgi:hypothetical protein